MKKTISLVLILTFIIGLTPGVADARLVACVGDSITFGFGISSPSINSYPAQLERILRQFDDQWETQNFGVSGATLLRNTSKPYVVQNAYNRALASEPEVVIIQLGSNDTARATSSQIEQDFIPDYLALIDAFAQLPSQPKIFVCNPPPMFGGGYGSNTKLRDVIIPLIQQLPTYRAVEVIDMYTPLEESGHLFPDHLHPNAEGAKMIAEIVASVILGFRFSPDFNGDWKVDIEDLIMLIEHWGQDEPSVDIVPAPFGDGIVDRADLKVLMAYWGQEINDPTLVAHWALDEAEGTFTYDSAGTCDGRLSGNPLWQPAGGMVNGALQFDGVDDYIFFFSSIPNIIKGPFSVFAWIKGGRPGQVVISQTDRVNWLCADSLEGNLMTELKGTGQYVAILTSQSVITDGNWHRIGFVWDGSYRTLYVDNVAVAEDTQDNLEVSENRLYIGIGKDREAGTYWSGLIDDVRIYNRAVTP